MKIADHLMKSKKGELNSEENGKGATEEKQQSRISESQKINYRVQYQGLKKGPSVSVKSKPANLNPVIDKDGLLRCNERMKHVKSICPMILDIQ